MAAFLAVMSAYYSLEAVFMRYLKRNAVMKCLALVAACFVHCFEKGKHTGHVLPKKNRNKNEKRMKECQDLRTVSFLPGDILPLAGGVEADEHSSPLFCVCKSL